MAIYHHLQDYKTTTRFDTVKETRKTTVYSLLKSKEKWKVIEIQSFWYQSDREDLGQFCINPDHPVFASTAQTKQKKIPADIGFGNLIPWPKIKTKTKTITILEVSITDTDYSVHPVFASTVFASTAQTKQKKILASWIPWPKI